MFERIVFKDSNFYHLLHNNVLSPLQLLISGELKHQPFIEREAVQGPLNCQLITKGTANTLYWKIEHILIKHQDLLCFLSNQLKEKIDYPGIGIGNRRKGKEGLT